MHSYQVVDTKDDRVDDFMTRAPVGKKASMWASFKFWRTRRRTALGGGCAVAAFTLLLNLSATLYLHTHSVSEGVAYFGNIRPINPWLYRGDCSTATKLNTYVHILINVLSTLLLAASNMFMQMLLAPTRVEIDRAHQRQRWLEIGVPNVRNLLYISWRNRILWFLLAFSSLPLHLIFNSAIYLSKPMNHVKMAIVTPDFLTGARADTVSMYLAHNWRREQNMTGLDRRQRGQRQLTYGPIDHLGLMVANNVCATRNCSDVQKYVMEERYQRTMNPYDCLTTYSKFDADRADVVFVSRYDYLWNMSSSVPHFKFTVNGSEVVTVIATNATQIAGHTTNSLLYSRDLRSEALVGMWLEYEWLCGNTNSFDCRLPSSWAKDRSIVENWNIMGYKIDECLVTERPLKDLCAVSYSLGIMITVCCVNFLKLGCMLFSLSILSTEIPEAKPLSTTGDAIASFLSSEDHNTNGWGLQDKKTLTKSTWSQPTLYTWTPHRARLFRLISKKRLYGTFGLLVAVVLGGAGAMAQNFYLISARSGTPKHILEIPFGATDQSTFGQLSLEIDAGSRKSTMKAFLSIVMFANMWQLLLSLLYMCFNGLLTSFCVEAEWQTYAMKRKSLRVSSPIGKQRSTYFLSLPLRYGVPLMLAFTILHWTLSQSIFLAVLAVYKAEGFAMELLVFGSSPRPLIITVGIGVLLALGLMGICSRKAQGILPRGGSCSAIISAACHGPPRDVGAALGLLQWGEVVENELPERATPAGKMEAHYQGKFTDATEYSHHQIDYGRYGHCCFTAYDVVIPTVGKLYY